MNKGLDFTEFENFTKQIKDFEQLHHKFSITFLEEMGNRALRRAKKLTPVRTGDLKRKWFLSDVYMNTGNILGIDLINNLKYASWVEDGHFQNSRWVPGKWVGDKFVYMKYADNPTVKTGMMLNAKWIEGKYMARIATTAVDKEMPKRYEAAFNKFIKQLGV